MKAWERKEYQEGLEYFRGLMRLDVRQRQFMIEAEAKAYVRKAVEAALACNSPEDAVRAEVLRLVNEGLSSRPSVP